MSEKCPFCGEPVEVREGKYRRYRCGTYGPEHGEYARKDRCIINTLRAENERLQWLLDAIGRESIALKSERDKLAVEAVVGETFREKTVKPVSRPTSWTRKLTMLVGQCIADQRSGFDVLASESWDRVCEHWAECENRGD